ncbi:uncharacterized protein N7511_001945 [Penicillium nucicola]|uniref:uncharacterized protein n=1 Tax=Penicillium nucicola TaxID=1850975 RepID=UPI002544DEF0|nr:uncharacterized protein N7511_001945 [Penicillium nucicola]KAJ5769894.1 hypothetical protein N7511_001945 [Penicillium nucicola]
MTESVTKVSEDPAPAISTSKKKKQSLKTREVFCGQEERALIAVGAPADPRCSASTQKEAGPQDPSKQSAKKKNKVTASSTADQRVDAATGIAEGSPSEYELAPSFKQPDEAHCTSTPTLPALPVSGSSDAAVIPTTQPSMAFTTLTTSDSVIASVSPTLGSRDNHPSNTVDALSSHLSVREPQESIFSSADYEWESQLQDWNRDFDGKMKENQNQAQR